MSGGGHRPGGSPRPVQGDPRSGTPFSDDLIHEPRGRSVGSGVTGGKKPNSLRSEVQRRLAYDEFDFPGSDDESEEVTCSFAPSSGKDNLLDQGRTGVPDESGNSQDAPAKIAPDAGEMWTKERLRAQKEAQTRKQEPEKEFVVDNNAMNIDIALNPASNASINAGINAQPLHASKQAKAAPLIPPGKMVKSQVFGDSTCPVETFIKKDTTLKYYCLFEFMKAAKQFQLRTTGNVLEKNLNWSQFVKTVFKNNPKIKQDGIQLPVKGRRNNVQWFLTIEGMRRFFRKWSHGQDILDLPMIDRYLYELKEQDNGQVLVQNGFLPGAGAVQVQAALQPNSDMGGNPVGLGLGIGFGPALGNDNQHLGVEIAKRIDLYEKLRTVQKTMMDMDDEELAHKKRKAEEENNMKCKRMKVRQLELEFDFLEKRLSAASLLQDEAIIIHQQKELTKRMEEMRR